MVATLATFTNVLKEDFEPELLRILNNETEVWNAFMRGTAKWEGRNWNKSIKTSRNSGTAYTDGTLPTAGQQGYQRLQGTAKRLYATVHIDALLMEAARSGGINQVIDWAEGELQGVVEDLSVYADRRLVSGGTCVGFLSGQSNAATQNFDGDFDKVAAAIAAGGGTCTVSVIRGDTYAATAGTLNASDAVNGTVTFTAAFDTTPADNDRGWAVVINDAAVEAALNTAFQPVGIYGNLGLPTHHSVDRTTATGTATVLQSLIFRQPTLENQTRVALTRARMKRVMTEIYLASGKRPDEIWMPARQIERYEDIVLATTNVSQMHVSGERATRGDAGIAAKSSDETGLSFEGIPIKRKRHLDNGLILFMQTKNKGWTLEELRKGGFESRGGGILQPVGGDDSFEGYWKAYHELVCCKPNRQAVLTGLAL